MEKQILCRQHAPSQRHAGVAASHRASAAAAGAGTDGGVGASQPRLQVLLVSKTNKIYFRIQKIRHAKISKYRFRYLTILY